VSSTDSLPNDAVTQIYRDHHGWLSGWLRKKLGNSFDAADLAHDTFVRLMGARVREGGGAEPRALLTHIAKGLVVDHWRRRARWKTPTRRRPRSCRLARRRRRKCGR